MHQSSTDIEKIKKLPVFFIIGSPRSGTTMLRTIFDAHPNVNIPFEFPFVLYLKKKYGHITFWDRRLLHEFYAELQNPIKWDFWKIERWNINQDEFQEGLYLFEGTNTFADICMYVFYSFNSSFEKTEIKILGDKNPSYSLYYKDLAAVFPDAKFLYLIRDYHAQIDSINHLDFGSKLTPLLAMNWLAVQKKIFKELKKNIGNIYKIKYEDLVKDPELIVKGICNYLHIEFIPEVLEYRTNKKAIVDNHSSEQEIEKYQANLFKPISEEHINKWEHTMPAKEIRMADFIVGRWAGRLGYERKYNKASPLLFFYVLPIYLHRALQKFIWLFVRMLPHKTRNNILYKKSVFEKLYEKIYIKLRGL